MNRSSDNGPAVPDTTNAFEDATEIVQIDSTLSLPLRAPFVEGRMIGEYVVDRVLGEGGGGKVFAAHHRQRGERVAIKVLRPEMVPLPALVMRFNREVEAINKIRHPNIVQVIECGQTEQGQPYYVMELLDGMNLRQLLERHGRFSPVEALELLKPICSALQAVHAAGFVHRDVKASNVLVVDAHGDRSLKLLDFGIAKTVHGEAELGLTEPGVPLGSAHNMAPEQVRCERLDARADIYALGVVLFQLLTGEYPFHAEDPRAIALMHLQSPPPRPSSRAPVPHAVDVVVLRCLEKAPERRFASATELVMSLCAALETLQPSAGEREVPALGVYIELRTHPGTELDDAMIEDISHVLDRAEQCLAAHGFSFPLHTSSALLAVRISNATPAPDGGGEEALAAVRAALQERPDPHPDVEIAISMRADSVSARATPAGDEAFGGALLDVRTWTAEHRA